MSDNLSAALTDNTLNCSGMARGYECPHVAALRAALTATEQAMMDTVWSASRMKDLATEYRVRAERAEQEVERLKHQIDLLECWAGR